jgi:hypothetical protein
VAEITRSEYLNALDRDWGTLVERYGKLTAEEKARFVQAQGYARFADLLAHFIAW